jgi:hypothetical protein
VKAFFGPAFFNHEGDRMSAKKKAKPVESDAPSASSELDCARGVGYGSGAGGHEGRRADVPDGHGRVAATAEAGGCRMTSFKQVAQGLGSRKLAGGYLTANGVLSPAGLAIHSTPEQFKTTLRFVGRLNGETFGKAATTALTFTAAHVVTASKFGIVLVQITPDRHRLHQGPRGDADDRDGV